MSVRRFRYGILLIKKENILDDTLLLINEKNVGLDQ